MRIPPKSREGNIGKSPEEVKVRRTAEQANEALSYHYIEGFILRSGCTWYIPEPDNSYDRFVNFYDDDGFYKNGGVYVQVKHKDTIAYLADGRTIAYSLERKYINTWRREVLPVVFILYDVGRNLAYWLDMHEVIHSLDAENRLRPEQEYVTLNFDREHDLLDNSSIENWNLKNDQLVEDTWRHRNERNT